MISKLMKKKNQKGFTLMEMLIVIAIIAVLVAIMIPTMTSQLENARESADAANIRSIYAEAMVKYITTGEAVNEAGTDTDYQYTLTQKNDGWDNTELETALGNLGDVTGDVKKGGTCTIKVSDTGDATIAFTAGS